MIRFHRRVVTRTLQTISSPMHVGPILQPSCRDTASTMRNPTVSVPYSVANGVFDIKNKPSHRKSIGGFAQNRLRFFVLLRSKDTITGITKSGHDIGPLVQTLVNRTRKQTNILVGVKDSLDSLGGRDDHEQTDIFHTLPA